MPVYARRFISSLRPRWAARKTFGAFSVRVQQRALEEEKALGRDVSASEVAGCGGDGILPAIRDGEPSSGGWQMGD